MRWILAFALLLLPTVSLAQALAPQSNKPPPPLTQGPTWSLQTWPTTAMMTQMQRKGGVATLLRTLQCTNGDKRVVERHYQQPDQAAPAGAVHCGRLCQFNLDSAAIGGLRRPESFTERQSTMKATRRLVVEDLRAQRAADPWREVDDSPLDLLAGMAKACRLAPPQMLANPKWIGFDQRLIARPAGGTSTNFPYVFVLPAALGDSVPLTKPLTIGQIPTPWLLRLRGRVTAGGAAVSVRSADNALLSDEATVAAGEGERDLFFYLDPSMVNARLVVRNVAAASRGGAFVLTDMEVLPRALLDEDDKIDLQAAMAEQTRRKPDAQATVTGPGAGTGASPSPFGAADADTTSGRAAPLDPHGAMPGVPLPPRGVTSAFVDPHADVNQCRAACGRTWIADGAKCAPVTDVLEPPSVIMCKRRIDKAYNACLATCGPDPTGTPPPPVAKPKQKPSSKKSK